MTEKNIDSTALVQLVQNLGLGKIYKEKPKLVLRAYESSRTMAHRLQRLKNVSDEPSHIFQADNNV